MRPSSGAAVKRTSATIRLDCVTAPINKRSASGFHGATRLFVLAQLGQTLGPAHLCLRPDVTSNRDVGRWLLQLLLFGRRSQVGRQDVLVGPVTTKDI